MGIMEMSMQPTLWCDRSTTLSCFLAWDMGEFDGNSLWPVWQHAGFNRDCEQEKEETYSLMENVTPVYRINSRALMALSTSMDPFLNTSESWLSAATNSNTFYKVLSLVLGLLYIIVHENCKLLGKYAQFGAFRCFFLILLKKIFEEKKKKKKSFKCSN